MEKDWLKVMKLDVVVVEKVEEVERFKSRRNGCVLCHDSFDIP